MGWLQNIFNNKSNILILESKVRELENKLDFNERVYQIDKDKLKLEIQYLKEKLVNKDLIINQNKEPAPLSRVEELVYTTLNNYQCQNIKQLSERTNKSEPQLRNIKMNIIKKGWSWKYY